MTDLAQNLSNIQKKVAAAAAKSGRQASDIKVIAVSKTVDIDTVNQAMALGVTDFGENRVQELSNKAQNIPNARWHMIGRLQTNKVKDVIDKVVLIHSLDRWSLAEAINSRAEHIGLVVPVLLQVNIAGEEQKAGVEPGEVRNFLESVGSLPRLKVLGFMTMAPEDPDAEKARPFFKELFLLREKLGKASFANVDLKYLSMGMSQDYEVAIEEGANLVRIGSSIFGNR